MLKKVLAAATIAGALTGGVVMTAGPALAAGQVCYDIHINAAPAPAVDQTSCTPLPA